VLEYYATWRETRTHAAMTLEAALCRLPGRTSATYREAARSLELASILAGQVG
jgi:hypothetical protein